MKKSYLNTCIICFLLQFIFPTLVKSQSNSYANLMWKDVEDGALVGQRCLQLLDLDNDGKEEVLASGHLGGDIEHFFIYKYINGQYIKKWDSKLYLKGINAITTFKSEVDNHYKICVLSNYNQVEIYDGITLNVVESFNLPYGEVVEIAIDNVDDAPDKELILIGRSGLKVYSLTTKQLKWSSEDIKGFDVKIGDLDNDGKKEIITSTRGWELPAKVYVLSAYTKTIKWSSSEKQLDNVYLFDVNDDGFLDIVGATTSEIVYFNSQTQRPITLVSSAHHNFSGVYYIGDIDKDGKSEVLVGIQFGGVAGFNFNGIEMWSVGVLDYSLIRFAVGDPDGDGETEVVRGTSSGSSGDMHLYINDFKTKRLEYGNTINFGYSTFGISDFDNDGGLDLVVANTTYKASTSNFANYSKGQFRNYNLTNRQKNRTTFLPFNSLDQLPMHGIGQSRDKLKREFATDLGIYDALTHEVLLDASDFPLWGVFKPMKFADVDNDGIDEILSSAYGKFQVYKYIQGKYKLDWELSLSAGIYYTDAVVKNIDADTAKEIITAHNYGKVTIFDAKTKELEWQSEDIKAICLDIADIDLDGKLELIIGTDNGVIIILDAQTKQEKKRIYGFSFTIRQVKAVNLDTTPQLEIIAVESDVKIFDSKTGQVVWDMPDEYDGVFPELFSIEAHDVDKDGYMELYFANRNGLFIFGINQPVKNGTTALHSDKAIIPMSCSPNPSNGIFELTFSSENIGKMSLELVNTEGVVVVQQSLEMSSIGTQKQQLDFSNVSNGLYILSLKTQDGIAYKKIIISK